MTLQFIINNRYDEKNPILQFAAVAAIVGCHGFFKISSSVFCIVSNFVSIEWILSPSDLVVVVVTFLGPDKCQRLAKYYGRKTEEMKDISA
jgi:hypothetical protein